MNATAYNPVNSPVHAFDARAKIVLLFGCTAALLCVRTPGGLAIMAVACLIAAVYGRVPVARALRQLAPLGVIIVFTIAAPSFSFAAPAVASGGAVPLVTFNPAGFAQGCFAALRMMLLVLASLVLTTTTTNSAIEGALAGLLAPLGALGLPVRDVATIVSVALRFIPVTVTEFGQVRAAQASRGAQFDAGSAFGRMRTWAFALVPLFVGLYRRAGSVALAMDARCYGMHQTTQLEPLKARVAHVVVALCGLMFCAVVGCVL